MRLVLLAALLAGTATAQPVFVADLQLGGSGQPQGITTYAGGLYFSSRASDSLSELWSYDLATGQSGRAASFDADAAPFGFTVYDGRLFFAAPNGPGFFDPNYELWAYDAATGAAELVAEIQPGPDGSIPREFVVYDERLFFSADDGVTGEELWVYDAATDTVEQVGDLAPGSQNSGPNEFAILDGVLYFEANAPGFSSQLWAYDAATDELANLLDLDTGVIDITVYDGQLFFNAEDQNRRKLAAYDPATGAISVVWDGPSDRAGQGPRGLAVHDGRLFFSAPNVDFNDVELWVYDAATNATALAADLLPGSGGSSPGGFTSFGDRLLFSAGVTGKADRELWAYDGTTATVIPVELRDLNDGNDSSPYDLVVADGVLYFGASGGTGVELWSLADGADRATLASDIDTRSSSDPDAFAVLGEQLYFAAQGTTLEPGGFGRELWTYDAQADTARLVVDLYLNGSSDPRFLTAYAGRLYFSATDDPISEGIELWAYDPGFDVAYRAANVRPGFNDGEPTDLTVVGDRLYFAARSPTGRELWAFDATTGQATVVAEVEGAAELSPAGLTAFDDRLFFQARSGTTVGALAVYDPATGETRTLIDGAVSQTTDLTVVGDRLLFAASDADGRSLWAYEPISDAVVRLAVISPDPDVRGISDLAVFDGRLYFAADGGPEGRELWVYDESGARLVLDLRPGPDSSAPTDLVAFGGELLFSAVRNDTGRELWALGADGVRLAGDLAPGSSTPRGLTPYADRLYFAATDPVRGRELWAYASEVMSSGALPAPSAPSVSLTVSPNPSGARGARVRVQAPGESVQVTVHDLLGREVLVLHHGQAPDILDLRLPTRALPSGVYLVRVVSGSARATEMMTIAR